MGLNDIALRKAETVFNELDRLHTAISRRAFDLFRERGDAWGAPLADWLKAERQLVWIPAIEVRKKNGQFEVLAATPGVDAKALDVQITPEDVLIKADVHHQHTAEEGAVEVCEFTAGRLFRSVHSRFSLSKTPTGEFSSARRLKRPRRPRRRGTRSISSAST